MRETAGRIINYAAENQPIKGCTVSNQIHQEGDRSIFVFSLAANTSITPECYEYHKFIMVMEGTMEVVNLEGEGVIITAGQSVLTRTKEPVGMRTEKGCVYIEIGLRKEISMNELLKAGEVFKLGELLPYQDGKIVNMDLVNEPKMKFVIMSFDEGTGLSEHAAPGEALVFALDGEGVIGYEGEEYTIKAGETFKFDKMGKHFVKATKKFKMGLLLILE